MTTGQTGTRADSPDTTRISRRQDITLAVNAFVAADDKARDGNENARRERSQHLRTIRKHYWSMAEAILSAAVSKRPGSLEFTDDERLFLDLGLVDPRMLGSGGRESGGLPALLAELKAKGPGNCHYLTEWLGERYHQLQVEDDLSVTPDAWEEDKYASQLGEARKRVLSRLSGLLTGLPGVPLELSEAFRSGDMDKVIISAGLACLANPTRKNFLRRRQLWTMREQVVAKAKARVTNPATLRLFDLLNEVYASDWRARFENRQIDESAPPRHTTVATARNTVSVTSTDPRHETMLREARFVRMRMTLMGAVDGAAEPDTVMAGTSPRITKQGLAAFLPLAQAFDKSLVEMPAVIIVPGSGRGFFAWEAGCLLLAVRPIVSTDDSVATALAWLRMLDDHLNRAGSLRGAYERKFPGAVFVNDFPADYRAWLCRLTKGDMAAMQPDKRVFFRDFIGPDLSGALLPANLRGVGPQVLPIICRRLEKQVAAAPDDVNLHRRLAAIYWQAGEFDAAGLQYTTAMQLAPDDGETLFAAGMFMRGRGEGEAAADCFKFGVERAGDTMWGVYCRDALAGLL